ncbi:MAG: flagellar biosynthesis anti-sigma factor FlgM [Anaerolineales bacterium]|nr:flagellar biosynthesis anti-sigma factor FlgM [Anaerolineales bacterium]
MKIEHLPLQQTLKAQAGYATEPVRRTSSADRTSATDHAALSEEARLLSHARQALEETPDVREEKVTALRQQVQDGTYQVPLEKLASLLVKRLSQE